MKTTFGELPIGARFVMADSPHGEIKRKTGFARWAWADHRGFLPTAIGCRPDREVLRMDDFDAMKWVEEKVAALVALLGVRPVDAAVLMRSALAGRHNTLLTPRQMAEVDEACGCFIDDLKVPPPLSVVSEGEGDPEF